jgi:hypothetical protein
MSDIEPMRDENEPAREEKLSTAELAGAGQTDLNLRADGETRSFAPRDAERHETPLLAEGEISDLRERWTEIQAGFVDEPRRAVEDADNLVAQTMKRLAEMFAEERSRLEGQWDRGDKVSTEDLRVALQRYRSFFDRLLTF